MEASEFVFTWKIENFSFCQDTSLTFLESPAFVLPYGKIPCNNQMFTLRFFPRGESFEDSNTVECTLQNCNAGDKLDRPLIEIPLLDFNLSVLLSSGEDRVFHEGRILRKFTVTGGVGIICNGQSLDNTMYLQEDTLTIKCHFLNGNTNFASNEMSTYTRLVIEKHSFTWEIEKFDFSKRVRQIYIPSLSTRLMQSYSNDVWIQYTPEDNNGKFTFKYHASWKIGQIELISLGHGVMNPNKFQSNTNNVFKSSSIGNLYGSMKQLNAYVPDSQLVLYFEFEIWNGKESKGQIIPPFKHAGMINYGLSNSPDYEKESENEMNPLEENEKIPTMMEDMEKLYTAQLFCDFTLNVGGKSFPVHKSILSARSRVFYAMFDSDWKEKASKEVEIEDVDSETMDRLLKFVYFQYFQDLNSERAMKLFRAADKYQILLLKSKCVDFLLSVLTTENVCDILTLADMHQDNDLIEATKNFVFQHAKKIFQSAEWKRFKVFKLQLASEIMEDVCLQNL